MTNLFKTNRLIFLNNPNPEASSSPEASSDIPKAEEITREHVENVLTAVDMNIKTIEDHYNEDYFSKLRGEKMPEEIKNNLGELKTLKAKLVKLSSNPTASRQVLVKIYDIFTKLNEHAKTTIEDAKKTSDTIQGLGIIAGIYRPLLRTEQPEVNPAEGDPMAPLAPSMASPGLELRVNEVPQEEATAKQSTEAQGEKERLSSGDAAPKEVISQIFTKDVNMGINEKAFTTAEDLNLSPALVEQLRKYCQRTKEGVILNVDLDAVGAQTIDGTTIVEQSPGSKTIRVFVTPSKDGKFLQLSWDVRLPKQSGANTVLNHNTLNIALDRSAYKKEDGEIQYSEPNLANKAVDQEAETQNEYEKQYAEAVAKLRTEGGPGDRIVFQRPIMESSGDKKSRSYTAEITAIKMHNIDGRSDQFMVYRREVAPEKTRYQKMYAGNGDSINNLPTLPTGSTEGRISMMKSNEATATQRMRGIERSYKAALEDFSSEKYALGLNFKNDRSKFDKMLNHIFKLVENYGVNAKTGQMLADAGFKIQDMTTDKGRKLRVAMIDPLTKEEKSKEVEMDNV